MLFRISHNWTLKLTALIISVALWSHVRGQVNPWENANFKVRLKPEAPRGFLLLQENELPRTLVVSLRGPRLTLRGLKGPAPANPLATGEDAPLLSPSQLRATLDFTAPRKGTQRVPIKVESQIEDVEVVAVRPDEVDVSLDVAETREFTIRPRLTPGNDLQIEQVQQSSQKTIASGPSKLLDRVARVRAVVPGNKLKPGVLRLTDVPLQAVDRAGNIVASVYLEPAQVNLQIQAREKPVEKSVRIAVEIVGAPAAGYEVGAIEAVPPRMTIRGPRRLVSGIESVTATLDVSGARETLRPRVQVKLPEGVEAVSGNRVRVRVEIERNAAAAGAGSTPAGSAATNTSQDSPRVSPRALPRPAPAPAPRASSPQPTPTPMPAAPLSGSFPLQ